MTQPTQTETQVFYPALRYRDAKAAIEWLQRAFGFERHEVHEGEDGSVVHCEMGLGAGRVMFGSVRPDADRFGSHAGKAWTDVVVEDPDALFERGHRRRRRGGDGADRHRLRLARLLGPRSRGQPLALRDLQPGATLAAGAPHLAEDGGQAIAVAALIGDHV